MPDRPPGHNSRITTGRSWHDLPPSPPNERGPIPDWWTAPEPQPAPASAADSRIWPWVLGAVTMIVIGFFVGTRLASQGGPDPTPSALDAPSSTDSLPEQIIPPLPPDLTLPNGDLAPPSVTIPEELQPPSVTIPGLGEDVLFTLPEPPEGFSQTEAGLGLGPSGIQQTVVIQSETGEIRIIGSLQPGSRLPEGDVVEVRDTEGVWSEELTLVWVQDELLLVEIVATGDVSRDQILDVADRLEFM